MTNYVLLKGRLGKVLKSGQVLTAVSYYEAGRYNGEPDSQLKNMI